MIIELLTSNFVNLSLYRNPLFWEDTLYKAYFGFLYLRDWTKNRFSFSVCKQESYNRTDEEGSGEYFLTLRRAKSLSSAILTSPTFMMCWCWLTGTNTPVETRPVQLYCPGTNIICSQQRKRNI